MLLLKGFLVFWAYVGLDMMWAWYVSAVASKNAPQASSLSALITLFGTAGVLAAVEDPVLVFFAAAGAFAGTWWGVKKQ